MSDIIADPSDPGLLADPLIYVISFFILFVIALALLTWVLKVYYASYGCGYYANIWCGDTWRCKSACFGSGNNVTDTSGFPVDSCYGENSNVLGPTGLASCLYGPNSAAASLCYNPPANDPNSPACGCVSPLTSINAQNCFNGCASSLDDIPPGVVCCCKNGPNCTVGGECAPPPNAI